MRSSVAVNERGKVEFTVTRSPSPQPPQPTQPPEGNLIEEKQWSSAAQDPDCTVRAAWQGREDIGGTAGKNW